MAKAKAVIPPRTNEQIRRILLEYFYDRNKNATSARGKKGAAVKISDVKRELKAAYFLSQQEVQSNLTYLLSQGWVKEDIVQKSFSTARGTMMPSTTSFYMITAAGIDKIEGPGEFTMHKFQGIKIEATGQNIITLGDGNQIDAKFGDLGNALAALRDAVTKSDALENDKLSFVADIETIQTQLAKPTPNKSIIKSAWEAVQVAAALDGCSNLVRNAGRLIAAVLT